MRTETLKRAVASGERGVAGATGSCCSLSRGGLRPVDRLRSVMRKPRSGAAYSFSSPSPLGGSPVGRFAKSIVLFV